MCRLIGLAESSYYHAGPGHVDTAADQRLLKQLEQLAGKHPTYGYRRLTKLVRKRKRFAHVNSKRVRRILETAGIQAKKPTRVVFTTDSAHGFPRYPNLVRDLPRIDHPNQVWCSDTLRAYIVLATGEVVFLAIVLDVFTRCIRGWELGRDLTHDLTVHALRRALKRGVPEIHHSDQGVQYATPHYTQLLDECGVRMSMSDRGAAWHAKRGFAERWMRTLKEEEAFGLSEYETFEDALAQIERHHVRMLP